MPTFVVTSFSASRINIDDSHYNNCGHHIVKNMLTRFDKLI